MNSHRDEMLKERETRDLELFERIKNNPHPEILELWSLSEDKFTDWRRLNDYPILLAHFDKTLLLFKEWKNENNLTNQIIIESEEITPFLEHKKYSDKNKKIYLIEQTFDNTRRTYIDYGKIEGERIHSETTYTYNVLNIFVSYLDWLKAKGKKQEILYINSRHGPNHKSEKVFIHNDIYSDSSDFELLKMGGIEIPTNALGMLYRGKKMEFVNLCGLILKGEISYGELGNLSCSYCACDNWVAEAFSMPMLDFEHCTVTNFQLKNSEILQWSFYDCEVTGDYINSKLKRVKIIGGYFAPNLQDCTLLQVEVKTDKCLIDNNGFAYKTLKKSYANQGDDKKAKYYFIKENEFIRKHLKGWNYITKSLSYYYWEYGRKPHRIIYFSIAIILLFGVIYFLNKDLIALNYTNTTVKNFNFLDSLYFSTTTFTTLGYGDLSPLSGLRILSSIEAFLGVINMGFLIAGYSNNKY